MGMNDRIDGLQDMRAGMAHVVTLVDRNASADFGDVLPDADTGGATLGALVVLLADMMADMIANAGIALRSVTDETIVAALAVWGMSPFGIGRVAGDVADMVRGNCKYGRWSARGLSDVAAAARAVTSVRDVD